MPENVLMPRLSDSMQEGTVLKWLKHPGDKVTKGEPLVEIETDKANMELEAYASGTLQEIKVEEGETVPVGDIIGIIETGDGTGAAARPAPTAQAAAAAPAQEAPPAPAPQAPPAEAPPQAARQVEAPAAAGREMYPQPAEPAPAEQATAAPAARPTPPPSRPEATSVPGREPGERIKASPLARRMAEEHDINLALVEGTGPQGRITKEDIENFMKRPRPEPVMPAAAVHPVVTPAKPAGPLPGQTVDLTRIRRTIARRMVESKTTVPHFYLTTEIDMTEAGAFRRQLNDALGGTIRIGFNDMAVKASALALRRYPEANASYHEDKLVLHEQVNVGIAVAAGDALIVPVLRDADKKNLREIAVAAGDLVERTRAGKITPAELEGQTFSVSNLGMYDVDEFSAIVNPPDAAILAVGSIRAKPVVVDGQIVIRDRMRVTLSCDHRVLYGAPAAEFLQEVKRLLEKPALLVL
jgi:pyruvate dehydrogenase E2 component (dihydrolipoamide acetyltransferase)